MQRLTAARFRPRRLCLLDFVQSKPKHLFWPGDSSPRQLTLRSSTRAMRNDHFPMSSFHSSARAWMNSAII